VGKTLKGAVNFGRGHDLAFFNDGHVAEEFNTSLEPGERDRCITAKELAVQAP
jgi:hypothetical protein